MAIVGRDFRGVRLCEACWNGVHWSKAYRGKLGEWHPSVNQCKGGGCQCPCPQMPADRSGINRALRELREKNRKAQMQLPDPGVGYEHANPEDVKALRDAGFDPRERR